MTVALRLGAQDYVGSKTCGACHPDKLELQSRSAHAHALARAPANSPGEWAFGAGQKAITYVSRVDEDSYVEHGLSYFASTQGFAPTPGHKGPVDLRYPTLEPGASILRCFRCHSTGQLALGNGFTIQPAEYGVRCEACHGPGSDHVKAGGTRGTIRKPSNLNAVELNELCGTCHRKPPAAGEEIAGRIAVGLKFDWSDSWNTRHQPAYLSQSSCFRASKGALSCLTCHDPHGPLSHSAASYDGKCLSCHPRVPHRNAVAQTNCISCHMPQAQAARQFTFTNHWIGIYAKGGVVPINANTGTYPPLVLPATSLGRLKSPNDPSSLQSFFEAAVEARERASGKTDPKVARSATTLALFLKDIGQPEAALQPLRRAIEIDVLNRDPEAMADEERLGQMYQLLGRPRDAIGMFQEAAASSDFKVSARSYASLAKLEPEKAVFYYENAIKAEESASGRDSPRMAAILSNFALVLAAKGELVEAETLLRRALNIEEHSIGRGHYQTAVTLSNLGGVLQRSGNLKDAERLGREAMTILERTRPRSIELAAACTNLGGLLAMRGERDGGATLLKRAVSIDETVLGRDHPQIASDLVNLAGVLIDSGDRSAGQALLRRALVIYETRFGISSVEAAAVRGQIARSGM
ncbi:MAG: tetratricopeptide repeat protein [Bryobacteraceae bacterium]